MDAGEDRPAVDASFARSRLIAYARGVRRLLLVAFVALGCAGDPAPPSSSAPQLIAPDPEVVHLLGTGAMTPLSRQLVAAWPKAPGSLRFVVEPSVGSGGGARAAAEGAVDLGMIARPLTPSENALGLLAIPVAIDAVVVAANRDVPLDGLERSKLVDLVAGRTAAFPDGSIATVLLRDREESANQTLEHEIPGLEAAREEAYRAHRLRVLYHDDAMGEALAATPGSIGVFSLGAITIAELPLKVLSIDTVRPSLTTITNGEWKAVRTLSFVVRKDRLDRVRAFLDFVASSAGQRLIKRSGYQPVAISVLP